MDCIFRLVNNCWKQINRLVTLTKIINQSKIEFIKIRGTTIRDKCWCWPDKAMPG